MKLQEIKRGENEGTGVSRGAALLFLNSAGIWNCYMSPNNTNTRFWELLSQMNTDLC